MSAINPPCRLTDAQCEFCIRVIRENHALSKAELDDLRRANFPLEQLEQYNDSNRESALNLLRVYAPTRVPYDLQH